MKKKIYLLAAIATVALASCGEKCYECTAGGAMSMSMTFCESNFETSAQFEEALEKAKKSGAQCEKK